VAGVYPVGAGGVTFDERVEASFARTGPLVAEAAALVAPEAPKVPTSYRGLYSSIFASPRRDGWPPDVQEWLEGRRWTGRS
jgi:hypothetical protein